MILGALQGGIQLEGWAGCCVCPSASCLLRACQRLPETQAAGALPLAESELGRDSWFASCVSPALTLN